MPEVLHTGVFKVIVSDGVDAAVERVAAEVWDVDFGIVAADEGLKFCLVEHGEPGGGNDGPKAFEESAGLEVGLNLKAVAGDVGDVDEAIFVGDGDLGALRTELTGYGFLLGVAVGAGGEGVCNGKVEGEVFDVAGIVFQLKLEGRG